MNQQRPHLTATRVLVLGVWAALLAWLVPNTAFSSGEETLAWVQVGGTTLSSGTTLPQALTPGQWVVMAAGGAKSLAQWKPPQDIERRWLLDKAGRITFSHERHFGMIGTKNCLACHADEKGMGSTEPRKSLAASPELEPHNEKSLGRFCSTCHNGSTQSGQIEEARPRLNISIFSAMGKTGDSACNKCHVPTSHGADFTATHKTVANTQVLQCLGCHRGGPEISQRDWSQARQFVSAQLELLKNPNDTKAFSHTLPNNFCAYCHSTQNDFWRIK